MIGYSITSGVPTSEEVLALEEALKRHEKPHVETTKAKSAWAAPQLRAPLSRKV